MLLPNRWHARLVASVQSERKEEDVFPTLYKCNTTFALRRQMKSAGFDAVVYGHGTEPRYLNFSKAAYAIGVLHQKLAPGVVCPELFAFGRRI
jgi:hypothetical protein